MLNKFDFPSWIEHTFGKYHQPHPNEYIIDCPKCGAKGRCSLNPAKRLYNCYKCGGGYLYDWVAEYAHVDRKTASRWLSGWLHEDESVDGLDALEIELGLAAPVQPIEQPKVALNPYEAIKPFLADMLPIGYGNALADGIVRPYLTGRGFNLEVAKTFGLLYCHRGKFKDRLIIPAYENGGIAYFQGRTLIGALPKYYNPSTKDGVERDHWLFNLDGMRTAAQMGYPVVLCEGGLTAMSVGWSAGALFGKHISTTQENKLRQALPFGATVIVAFDYSTETKRKANSLALAQDLAMALSGQFRTGWVNMPDERDLNDWLVQGGYAAVHALIQSQTVWTDSLTIGA